MTQKSQTTVKLEQHDDKEIDEMAKKIMEQNRAKMTTLPVSSGRIQMQMAKPGQPTIQNYLGRQNDGAASTQENANAPDAPTAAKNVFDLESRKGRFGWCEFEKDFLPFIFRLNGERFTSVRMVERKFLNKLLNALPTELNSCLVIRSYYVTESECKLLNEINAKHSDCQFGQEAFTTKDLVVRLNDAKEFILFLDICYKKLVLKKSNATDRCGYFRINGESVVPYTVREGIKFVPLFYFEGDTDHLKQKAVTAEGWDLAYLKFCCKVQGIRGDLFCGNVCQVVALDDIKGHFPSGTIFEDYWPSKGSMALPVRSYRAPSAGNWTQRPAAASVATAASAVSAAMAASAAVPVNTQHHQQQISAYMQALTVASQHQLMRQGASQSVPNNAPFPHVSCVPANGQQQQLTLRLMPIKEFPIQKSQQPAYKLQKALIDQKIVPCINVKPYVFHDLMMTLPDFVKSFCPELEMANAHRMLQDILKVVLYKGNRGHQDLLKADGKCLQYDPVPLLLVKDIMNYMPQMKYMFANQSNQTAKRLRVN